MTSAFGALRTVPCLLVAAVLMAGCAAPERRAPVQVRVLAINDFHGNLRPPAEGILIRDPQHADRSINVPAGGAEHLATAVRELRAGQRHHVFVAAGDLVGASQLLSALFDDEPTIESLGMMGLEISAVGNHEFDNGAAELLRKQHGGCHPEHGCKGPRPFTGASFQYLSASTWDLKRGETLLPAYRIKQFDGIPVAFIGLTLKGTPGIVMPSAVEGLRFDDEAETVNRLVPGLRAQGVEAIVVLIHEGGFPTGDYNECPGISGAIVDIVRKLDRAVDLVVSGHTHKAYNCRIDGRLVTSGDKYGTLVTRIDLSLDPATRDVISARADNVIVRTDHFAADPDQTALIAAYDARSAPLVNRVVGHISESLTRVENDAGATTMGQALADAQLLATAAPDAGGAVIALTNTGGMRSALTWQAQGEVRYGDAFNVQPFYNNLITMSLSAAQIRQVLEEQWLDQPKPRPLQVSRGFAYAWDAKRPIGQRVVADSLRLNGQPLQPDRLYRVTVNAFLAVGGDGFPGFTAGQQHRTGPTDIDALVHYLESQPLTRPTALDRVQRID